MATAHPRERLTRERIVDAALRIVDADGLDALSLRRQGQELGVEAMSLSHHVPNKSAMLGGVVELLLGRLGTPGVDGEWQEHPPALAWAYRRLAYAHPNAFPLIAMREHQTPQVRRLREHAAAICRRARATEEEGGAAFDTLAGFVSVVALFEIGGFFDVVGVDRPVHAPIPSSGARQLDDRHPNSAGGAQFAFGLEVVLDGLEGRFSARGEQDRNDMPEGE